MVEGVTVIWFGTRLGTLWIYAPNVQKKKANGTYYITFKKSKLFHIKISFQYEYLELKNNASCAQSNMH